MKTAADAFLEGLYACAPRSLSVRRALCADLDWTSWRAELISAVRSSMGRVPKRAPLNVRELERVQKDGYARVKIAYASEAGFDTPAYLLIPDGAKGAPAVVACTGHGFGARDIVGLDADFREKTGDPGYQKNFAVELVRRGFVVLAPEPMGFGELMLSGDKGNSCYRISGDLLLVGRTMLGTRVAQFQAAVSLLASLPEVDEQRVGAMGISGGGQVVSFLSMLDERVRAVVVSGYACMYRLSIFGQMHCIDNFPMGLLNYAENDDLMSLIAPRPMLWEAGSVDPIFPRAGVLEAARTVSQVYAALGAPDAFEVDCFEGDHQISGRRAYDFLTAALG